MSSFSHLFFTLFFIHIPHLFNLISLSLSSFGLYILYWVVVFRWRFLAIYYVRIETEWNDKPVYYICGSALYALAHVYSVMLRVLNADLYIFIRLYLYIKIKTLIRSCSAFAFRIRFAPPALSLFRSPYSICSNFIFIYFYSKSVSWLNNGRFTFTHHQFFFRSAWTLYFSSLAIVIVFWEGLAAELFHFNVVHSFIAAIAFMPWIFPQVRFFISSRFLCIVYLYVYPSIKPSICGISARVCVSMCDDIWRVRMRRIINIIYERVSLWHIN